MTDRLDNLERLQRLREGGTIDDAEFAREKGRLLAEEAPASNSEARRVLPMLGVVTALAVVGAFVALTWSLIPGGETPVVPVAGPAMQNPTAAPNERCSGYYIQMQNVPNLLQMSFYINPDTHKVDEEFFSDDGSPNDYHNIAVTWVNPSVFVLPDQRVQIHCSDADGSPYMIEGQVRINLIRANVGLLQWLAIHSTDPHERAKALTQLTVNRMPNSSLADQQSDKGSLLPGRGELAADAPTDQEQLESMRQYCRDNSCGPDLMKWYRTHPKPREAQSSEEVMTLHDEDSPEENGQ